MCETPLRLTKIPLRADLLAATARRRGIGRQFDEGYLVHCLLTEVWQDDAPAPFVVRGSGRQLDVWGYTKRSVSQLAEHARAFADPGTLAVFDGLTGLADKEMPVFPAGQRVGFLSKVCPVVRLAKSVDGRRAGAEVDAFLSRCFAAGPGVPVDREEVYREWFAARLGEATVSGVRLEDLVVDSISRVRLVRRTQGSERSAKTLERPEVRLRGTLVVEDGETFLGIIARGIGRHRAFGYGAVLVVAPGTTHSRQ
jgi:CRISPR system Cascade subunit CasE